jgi:glycosyltransferase involved in cell wall biosynthesis
MKPRRVLQVMGAVDRGGIETWLLRLLPHLDRAKWQLDIAVNSATPGAYAQQFIDLGVGIRVCPRSHRSWRYGASFRNLLREHGPYDIVQGQLFLFNGYLAKFAHQCQVPVRIAHMHPLTDIRSQSLLRGLYRQWMCHLIAKHATALAYPSQSSRVAFERIAAVGHLLHGLLPNCLELERFAGAIDRTATRRELGLPSDLPLLVYVARFATHKNHALVFDIVDELARRGLRVHAALAGSHGECLDALVARAGSHGSVTVLQGLKDVAPLLGCADAFVFPSLEEGFGVVAVEAQAAGLPVVASDMPSILEALCDGNRALTFPLGDAQAAADRLVPLLADDKRRALLAEQGRAFAARFSAPQAAKALSDFYDACLASCAAQPR